MKKAVFYYSKYQYHLDIFLSVSLVVVLAIYYLHLFPVADSDDNILILFTFFGTLPVFVSAVSSVLKREWASMDMLASIALVFSIVSKEWSSAVFISLMLSSARILQDITETRTRKNIDSLLKLRPEKAKVEVNGLIKEVKLKDVKVGDVVVVDTGEYIPIDGNIISGDASVNESSLTGESVPIEKGVNNKANSGTLIVSGSIKIKTLLVGKDTTLEKIISLIETAQKEKPQTQTLGEKFGKYYLATVFIGSFLLVMITNNLPLVLSVVLVVCADDIAVAIPLGYLRAIGSAAQKGIIIKGGKHLETLGKIEVVVFDKTGTLTTGKLKVSSVYATSKSSEEELIKLGTIASRRSHHPLAKAIVEYGEEKGEKEEYPDESDYIGGRGVITKIKGEEIVLGNEALMEQKKITFDDSIKDKVKEFEEKGDSISYFAKGGVVVGFFSAADTIKKDAKEMVKELYALGIKKVVMLTGDNERVAKSVAKKIGIKDVHANLLPEDKLNRLRDFHKEYKVAMVGDGVNDAAALSISHVGIAMGALGSDSAIESAQIVLMHDNLSAIPKIISLARDVNLISKEDFGIWGVTNAFGLFLVFASFIGPPGAAAYNFISDFFPLLNSVRARIK